MRHRKVAIFCVDAATPPEGVAFVQHASRAHPREAPVSQRKWPENAISRASGHPKLRQPRFFTWLSFGVQAPAISARSIFTPGPMVEVTESFFTNLPFAPDGLPLMIASMKARKFSLR